jgi:hypothetical protein
VNTAAASAVATIRPPSRHKFFAPKADRSVTTLAGNDFDDGFVEEFHEWAPSVSVEAHFRASESYAETKAPQAVAGKGGADFNGGFVEELHE